MTVLHQIIDGVAEAVGFITIIGWLRDGLAKLLVRIHKWRQSKKKKRPIKNKPVSYKPGYEGSWYSGAELELRKNFDRKLEEQWTRQHYPYRGELDSPATMEIRRKWPNLTPWEIEFIDNYMKKEKVDDLIKNLDEAEVVEFISNNQKQLP